MIGGALARRVALLRESFPSEVDVKRVTTADAVYRLGVHLGGLRDGLGELRVRLDETESEARRALELEFTAKRWLDTVLEVVAELSAFVPLPQTTASLRRLSAYYAKLTTDEFGHGFYLEHIDAALTEVGNIATHELTAINLFYAAPVGDFEVTHLIEKGPFLDRAYRKLLPREALRDIRDAGRALAFGLPTAVGFHLFRAMEAAMRLYFPLIKYTPKDSDRNWSNYINAMRGGGVAERITDFLDHIRREYRNPITHPEASLTREEAQALMAVAMSAIRMMLADLLMRARNEAIL